jgi:hypothetical protein
MIKPRRPWDDPRYRKRRELLMASITPATRCWRCGKTAPEHPLHANGKRGRWQAGHTVDGRNDAPLAAEFSTCNASAGGKLGHQRAFGRNGADRHRRVDPHLPSHYSPDGWSPCKAVSGEMCSACRDWHAANPKRRG